jgi:phosphatidylserine decarboxylase
MTIHKEGYKIIAVSFLLIGALVVIVNLIFPSQSLIHYLFYTSCIVFYGLIVSFFRIPYRKIILNDNQILCPADGEVVVIEEVEETEFFHEKRLQVSVFMSPLNVHCNRYPVSGFVKYFKYHPGLYLVAWHPKSSTENERTTVVVEDSHGRKILVRQIAGAVARRIVCYSKEGDSCIQGEDLGFIKFGSRVDLFLPLDVKINVQLKQKVKGGIDVIALFE